MDFPRGGYDSMKRIPRAPLPRAAHKTNLYACLLKGWLERELGEFIEQGRVELLDDFGENSPDKPIYASMRTASKYGECFVRLNPFSVQPGLMPIEEKIRWGAQLLVIDPVASDDRPCAGPVKGARLEDGRLCVQPALLSGRITSGVSLREHMTAHLEQSCGGFAGREGAEAILLDTRPCRQDDGRLLDMLNGMRGTESEASTAMDSSEGLSLQDGHTPQITFDERLLEIGETSRVISRITIGRLAFGRTLCVTGMSEREVIEQICAFDLDAITMEHVIGDIEEARGPSDMKARMSKYFDVK